MEEVLRIWESLSEEIEKLGNIVAFDMWIKNLEPLDIDCGTIILVTSTKSQKEIVNKELRPKILKAISNLNNPILTDYKVIDKDEKENYKKTNIVSSNENIQPEKFEFNENYTFNTFVVGSCNQIAAAAALAVAKDPGSTFSNPLFIYGGVGLGKTHILHAIGNYCNENNKKIKIIYTTTEQFVNDYIFSLSHNKTTEQVFKFREKYRNADILMIDDIQFIEGKTSSQEALFHTFNDLYQAKKQIIITADKHPKELVSIEERLKSRFTQGLNVSVDSPDVETRIAILQKKALQKNFNISSNIINFMAENLNSNIREMEGALNKVVFYCQLNGKNKIEDKDLDLVKDALKDELGINGHIISIDTIVDAVCSYFSVSKDDIKGNRRTNKIAIPRQIAIYLIIDMLSLPQQAIGNYFGGKDHTTILYARNKISDEMDKNSLLKSQIKDIKNILEKK